MKRRFIAGLVARIKLATFILKRFELGNEPPAKPAAPGTPLMRDEVSPAIQTTESADPALAMYSPVLGNGCGIKSWGVGTCTIAENTKLEGRMLNTLCL